MILSLPSLSWRCPPLTILSPSCSKDQDPFLAGVKGIAWKRPAEIGNPAATPVVTPLPRFLCSPKQPSLSSRLCSQLVHFPVACVPNKGMQG